MFLIWRRNNNEGKTNRLNLAAFHLHQAVEHFFIAIQLVFSRYNPKVLDIQKLSNIVADFGFDIHEIFPQDTEEENTCLNSSGGHTLTLDTARIFLYLKKS